MVGKHGREDCSKRVRDIGRPQVRSLWLSEAKDLRYWAVMGSGRRERSGRRHDRAERGESVTTPSAIRNVSGTTAQRWTSRLASTRWDRGSYPHPGSSPC